MNRTIPPTLGMLVAGAVVAFAPAQEQSHDALARARAKAQAENQRVLVLLTGGAEAVDAALAKSMADYASLGKLLRYEYQLAAMPVDSQPGKALASRMGVAGTAPLLAVLDAADDRVLGALSADDMMVDGEFSKDVVRTFLEQHPCEPRQAREVLADGLAVAKQTRRHAFVYLSAPW